MSFRVFSFLAFAVLVEAGAAQPLRHDEQKIHAAGEVTGLDLLTEHLPVVMRLLDGRVPAEHAIVGTVGNFEVRNIAPGTYQVTLLRRNGEVLKTDIVTLSDFLNRFTLRADKRPGSGGHTGTISLQRLRHKVPKAARKEFERGMGAAQAGDRIKALAHLRKAVEGPPRGSRRPAMCWRELPVQHPLVRTHARL